MHQQDYNKECADMKKLISILSAVTILSSFSFSYVQAVDFSSSNLLYSNSEKKESELTHTLEDVAKQFGSETDYFTFVNKAYMATADMSNLSYREFLKHSSNAEFFAEPEYMLPKENFFDTIYSGHCFGISVLEILNHNGYIKPSDLQDGAKFLTDVKFEGKARDILSYYQVAQNYTMFDLYMRWYFRTYSQKEKVEKLLETAEKSTKDGKYFLIIEEEKSESDKTFTHAVAGIGVTDGDWEINGEHYNKCILTFDSNAIRADCLPEFVPWGFVEDASIFVNTDNYRTYIPADECGTDNELNFFTLDDETLMNYFGLINPTENVKTDVSGINKIAVLSSGDYSIYADDFSGETFDVINSSYKKKYEKELKSYYAKGKNFTVNNLGTDFAVNISDVNRTFKVKSSNNAKSAYADKNSIKVISNGSEMDYDITKIENNPVLPYYFYEFKGETNSDITVSTGNDGIILSGKNGVRCSYDFTKPEYDNYGILVTDFEQKFSAGITSSVSVMLKYENGRFIPYIDNDKDDIFEYKVKQGDANCDGVIDAVDASVVLSGYASVATQHPSYCNDYLGDFNNDGSVNAIDASEILAFYAENSVK
jgi:hypothetical protein